MFRRDIRQQIVRSFATATQGVAGQTVGTTKLAEARLRATLRGDGAPHAGLVSDLRAKSRIGVNHKEDVAVIGVDMRGSTKLAEEHKPDEVFVLMQCFIPLLAFVVQALDGEVIGLRGDGLVAAFGFAEDKWRPCINRAYEAGAIMVEATRDELGPFLIELPGPEGHRCGARLWARNGHEDRAWGRDRGDGLWVGCEQRREAEQADKPAVALDIRQPEIARRGQRRDLHAQAEPLDRHVAFCSPGRRLRSGASGNPVGGEPVSADRHSGGERALRAASAAGLRRKVQRFAGGVGELQLQNLHVRAVARYASSLDHHVLRRRLRRTLMFVAHLDLLLLTRELNSSARTALDRCSAPGSCPAWAR
jgi:class 3 adenylate cyclase